MCLILRTVMKHRKPDLLFDLQTTAVEMPIASMPLYLADTKVTVFKLLVIFNLQVALLVGFYFKA